jgi:hypothetical protein
VPWRVKWWGWAVPKKAATSLSTTAVPSGLPGRPGATDAVMRPRQGSAGWDGPP